MQASLCVYIYVYIYTYSAKVRCYVSTKCPVLIMLYRFWFINSAQCFNVGPTYICSLNLCESGTRQKPFSFLSFLVVCLQKTCPMKNLFIMLIKCQSSEHMFLPKSTNKLIRKRLVAWLLLYN